MYSSEDLKNIVEQFLIHGTVDEIKPLGNGLINDTYHVSTRESSSPDYVLQRINHVVFQDVDLLQDNIEKVTAHIRRKLEVCGTDDIDRRVLRFIPTANSKTYYYDGQHYWRVMVYIPHAQTFETVNPTYSYEAGRAFGHFESMLADMTEPLGETIPCFHNMEFRLQQLQEAINNNPVHRLDEIKDLLEQIFQRSDYMCSAERLYREGKLPKRICHCDTKVNNMMFDEDGSVLCVIDLDTVMPSFIFSDYGDFLRTGANTGAEDEMDLSKVNFNMDIFQAFTQGYLEGASFLTPIEVQMLPYAAKLFPYMQFVRFLTDYINGDTYYKIQYPEHNLVRSRSQLKLLQSIESHEAEMQSFISASKKG